MYIRARDKAAIGAHRLLTDRVYQCSLPGQTGIGKQQLGKIAFLYQLRFRSCYGNSRDVAHVAPADSISVDLVCCVLEIPPPTVSQYALKMLP